MSLNAKYLRSFILGKSANCSTVLFVDKPSSQRSSADIPETQGGSLSRREEVVLRHPLPRPCQATRRGRTGTLAPRSDSRKECETPAADAKSSSCPREDGPLALSRRRPPHTATPADCVYTAARASLSTQTPQAGQGHTG